MIKLTQFSLKNVAAVIILMILLLCGGVYSATTLKMESMPDISFPVVVVATTYTAPPKDVLEDVTKPLEKAVANLQGLKNLTSTSNDNYSQIIIELNQGKKPEDVKQDVESLVQGVKLPADAEKPQVMTFGFASQPVYYMSVYGKDGMSQNELDRIYQEVIEPGLQETQGIDHIDSIGNQEATLHIKLDAGALTNYSLTPAQVVGAIQANMASSPAGSVELNGNTEMVRVTGNFDSVYGLDHMQIGTPTGGFVELSQISRIEAINESPFIARLDNNPAIGIHLYKTKDANAVDFGDAVDKKVAAWEKQYPDITFHLIYNDATSIKESISGMVREGGLGALLASLMILLFLRNLRMTFIVLVSIPLSILITLIFMAPLGISLNIMTLGGMAIAIGRVVDDSIVVIENNFSQLQIAQERNESVILLATKQVASAITSSTLTTVGVFGPIGLVSGVVGEVFRPFAITLACALLSSLIVALTVIPMLTKLLVLKSGSVAKQRHGMGKVTDWYKRALVWSLNHRKRMLLLALAIFLGSLFVTIPFLPMAFMPDSESDKQMYYSIKMPRETSFETMDAKVKEIEAMMREAKDPKGDPQFTYIESLVGYDFGSDRTAFKATLFTEVTKDTDAKKAVKQYEQKIQAMLPDGGEANGALISFGGGGASGGYTYSLKGDDELLLEQAAKQVEAKMKTFPELQDVKDSLGEKKLEIEVSVDPDEARLYGLTVSQVLGTVHSWIAEDKQDSVKLDNLDYTMKIGLDDTFKDSVDDITAIPIRSAAGTMITVGDVAKVQQIDAPASITREKQKQTVTVSATIDAKDKAGVSAKVSAALDQIALPPGVSREVLGVTEDINNGFSQMFMAMAASILIVYLVMVLAFGNARAPLAILFSLPLAAIGGLFGLLITGESLNVTSLIGFLMLIGIVVTNAIVLVDRVQQMREQGLNVRDALIEAGMTRLRPIIMTAGATIIALFPLALGLSKGTLISKGLAVVVIGGLTTSTLLTLVIVPIVYETLFRKRSWRRKAKKSQALPESAV